MRSLASCTRQLYAKRAHLFHETEGPPYTLSARSSTHELTTPTLTAPQLARTKAAELERLLQRLADVNDAIPAHSAGMARSHTVRAFPPLPQ
jgi:hypothetical protein